VVSVIPKMKTQGVSAFYVRFY